MNGMMDSEGRTGPSCEAMHELLSALIDQELTDDERLQVEGHLDVCKCCLRELDSLRRLHQHLVASVEIPCEKEPSADPIAQSLMPVHSHPKNGHRGAAFLRFRATRRAPRANRRWLALASAVALVGLLAIAFGRFQEPPPRIAGTPPLEPELSATLTQVVAPLGKLATTQDEIRERQDAEARTMAQELRLLRLVARTLPPDDEEANAVRAEIEQLTLKLQKVRGLPAASPAGQHP